MISALDEALHAFKHLMKHNLLLRTPDMEKLLMGCQANPAAILTLTLK